MVVCVFMACAESLDGVMELPDTQTSKQTDMNETYLRRTGLLRPLIRIEKYSRVAGIQIYIAIGTMPCFWYGVKQKRSVS